MDAYDCLGFSDLPTSDISFRIIGVLGPLARSARDLLLFCKTMLDAQPWLFEPPLLEMPWKETVANGSELPSKLSFGFIWDDGVVAPHPPIIQALQKVKHVLIAAGHEVIDWVPLNHQQGWDIIVSKLKREYIIDAHRLGPLETVSNVSP